jgi:hypothetical protein
MNLEDPRHGGNDSLGSSLSPGDNFFVAYSYQALRRQSRICAVPCVAYRAFKPPKRS